MKFDPAKAIQQLEQFGEFGGVNPSITDSATFTFLGAKTMVDTFHGETHGCYLYSRHWNPMNKYLSDALAAMEGTPAGWVTASGMAAITNTIMQLCNAGDHIVSSVTTYGGTYAFLKNYLPKFNIEVTFIDPTNLESIEKAVQSNTKLIYTETISNPLLQISDIPEMAKIANKHGIKLVVDNTFSPMMVSPYKLGAHIVVYSLTKFINGKNDLIAGAICADQEFINSLIDVNNGTSMLLGPALDPLRSSGILKNLNTLHVRMIQHGRNAMYLAEKLSELGLKISYPGLKKHAGHELLNSMMNKGYGYGGIMAIDLEDADKASAVMELMQVKGVGYLAVSLGYFKTL
ncbi:MAG: aminotransferase class I/II-fold pyridoxal phosphate-dependent enzyme, partial [Bacteroidales bacterium]|nr:aminotransferase class I/II-fold pyridoxal phosphate-dependent enzyme [Bacteroidales bacterium]